MIDLDTIDRKILSELDRDSRQAYSAIAKRTRTNKDTVKYRIEKLMEKGLVDGFYTVIDYSKLGFLSFRLYFKISDMPLSKKEEMINYLKNHKNISIFYRITGYYDFSFSVWVRDVWHYEQFWEEFNGKFGQYLLDYHLAIKTKYVEYTRNYLSDKKDEKIQFTVSKKSLKEDLDELDFLILTFLSTNARMPLTEMAKMAKTTVVTCRSRLKHLLKKRVIIGFRTMFNLEKLDYHYYKVDLWFSDSSEKEKIMQTILSHPNVIYTEKTVITSNFEFDLEVRDFREFISIMDEIEKQFPHAIKRYMYYYLIKNYKVNYLPSL